MTCSEAKLELDLVADQYHDDCRKAYHNASREELAEATTLLIDGDCTRAEVFEMFWVN